MLTKIDLCSMALIKLGENPIQSFSDDTAAAKLGRTLTDFVIDTLLAIHPWNFARHTYDLVANESGEVQIPSDVLRILKSDVAIRDNKFISPNGHVRIVAIKRVEPDEFPSYFSSLVATKLAMEFCIPLTSDQSIFRTLVALYESELQNAKFIDSTTSVTTSIENFSLISSRF